VKTYFKFKNSWDRFNRDLFSGTVAALLRSAVCQNKTAFHRHAATTLREGFTLLEIMMAISVLALIFTAVTVSLQGKWEHEQGKRCAQRMMISWIKARSYDFREGREWAVTWNAQTGALHAGPYVSTEEGNHAEPSEEPTQSTGPDLSFSMNLDKQVTVIPEEDQETLPVVHFLPNGRARFASVLVKSTKGELWRVRMNWAGEPMIEPVPVEERKKGLSGKELLNIKIEGKDKKL
jgi:prepilin-type N-terminal cleavage/methylation domain-containing protein